VKPSRCQSVATKVAQSCGRCVAGGRRRGRPECNGEGAAVGAAGELSKKNIGLNRHGTVQGRPTRVGVALKFGCCKLWALGTCTSPIQNLRLACLRDG